MYHKISHFLFGFFCYLVTKTVKNLTIENLEIAKKIKGPRIYVGNHPSTFDFCYFYNLLPDRPTFLMAKIVFGIPIVGWVVKNCGFIPVSANNPEERKAAYKSARWMLLDNQSLFICPEGGYGQSTPKGTIGQTKTGAVRLAMEIDVPIIPFGVDYSKNIKGVTIGIIGEREYFKMCWGGDYHVKFGELIYLKKGMNPRKATDFVMNKVKQLM